MAKLLILYSNKFNKIRFVIHVNPILHSYQADYRWCPFLLLIYYCYKASHKCISFQLCLFSITTHWCYSYLRICALPDFIVIESMLACQAFSFIQLLYVTIRIVISIVLNSKWFCTFYFIYSMHPIHIDIHVISLNI